MNDWKYVQRDPSEALAQLHFFSVTKKHACGEVETRITVKEFASPKTSDMKFLATAGIWILLYVVPMLIAIAIPIWLVIIIIQALVRRNKKRKVAVVTTPQK